MGRRATRIEAVARSQRDDPRKTLVTIVYAGDLALLDHGVAAARAARQDMIAGLAAQGAFTGLDANGDWRA
ncbi:MAG: hypothetical protein WCE38_13475 [Burkholderiales bacterium]